MACVSIGRIITLKTAIKGSPIKLVVNNVDITYNCSYSWSNDMLCWSCWSDYKEYKRLKGGLNEDFYLRILFHDLTVPTLYINNALFDCYSITICEENPFLSDPCAITSGSGFDIYSGWDCALQLQQQLADTIVCMVGVPIYYFRVNPDATTRSYTFKEYVMHNVESVKQIKMIVPDGQMPSSRPTLSEWDLEFDTDWDTEISKTQFATAFGDTAFPKQRDFVWVPMQKRMYMVNTAYEEKNEGFMWMATTWKLALVKWQDQSNIDNGDVDKFIDSLIVHEYVDVFENGEKREGEHTATLQLDRPHPSPTNLYNVENSDYIRKHISMNKMKIVDRQISHGNIVVTKNKYIFDKDSEITYQKPWCGDNGSLVLVFDFLGAQDEERSILRIGDWSLTLKGRKFNIGGEIEEGYTYLVLIRWGRGVGQLSINIYKLVAPTDIPSYRLKPNMYKFDFDHPITMIQKLDEKLIGGPYDVTLYGWPLQIANVKLYNKYINDEEVSEVLKYTTKDENCVINDQARPLNIEHGYSVR